VVKKYFNLTKHDLADVFVKQFLTNKVYFRCFQSCKSTFFHDDFIVLPIFFVVTYQTFEKYLQFKLSRNVEKTQTVSN